MKPDPDCCGSPGIATDWDHGWVCLACGWTIPSDKTATDYPEMQPAPECTRNEETD